MGHRRSRMGGLVMANSKMFAVDMLPPPGGWGDGGMETHQQVALPTRIG